MNLTIQHLKQRWQARSQQRIFIMPSRYGYAYVVLIFVMLLGAINYNNSLGHLLCFLLVSLGQVAMHHSHRNLRKMSMTATGLEPVFCEQSAQFRLTFSNEDGHDHYQLQVSHKNNPSRSRLPFLKHYHPHHLIDAIKADSQHSSSLYIVSKQRGWLSLNTVSLGSTYPLGLFRCWTLFSAPAQVLIYPKPAGDKAFPSNELSLNNGERQHDLGDDDFSGLRQYREGEPLHSVAWKAMARDEVMRSKQFFSPQANDLEFSWYSLEKLDTEQKLSQLCQWICEAENRQHRYGLVLPTLRIQPSKGPSHQHRCLKQLALYEE
ncbi:hypothetical protein LCGC14_1226310 [marine sediment metagenome]|uniref:Uncharacterized protein n=1 Tax=marine sediment metagenome TaxID=412755 RepID=A0A0F9PE66_9ZZZZ